jgi:hypothetical protein
MPVPGLWIFPAKDHLAAFLALVNETQPFQRPAEICSGQARWELHYRP